MNCQIEAGSLLYNSVLFRHIYNGIGQFFPEQICWLDYFISGFIIMFILVNGVLLGAAIYIWAERRILGRFQNRVGPNRWGPFGLLQPIADLVKLITKEDLIPSSADRLAFTLVPIIMVMPLILMLAVIPFARNTSLADLNIGVLYIIAITSVTTLGIFMAGWSSGNRFAMFGAMRGVAMLISYEVPTVLSLVGVVLLAGSMQMTEVVNAQTLPFILVQPLGMVVFLLGISAELNRTPFDIVEAESELTAGYHTEYSGTKFLLIQAAEFGGVIAASGVMATLFLGGWSGPLPVRAAGRAVVPPEGRLLRLPLHLGQGHVPAPAYRPDYGLRVEVPVPPQPHQPVRHHAGGILPARRRRSSDQGRLGDYDGDKHGAGRGRSVPIRHHD